MPFGAEACPAEMDLPANTPITSFITVVLPISLGVIGQQVVVLPDEIYGSTNGHKLRLSSRDKGRSGRDRRRNGKG